MTTIIRARIAHTPRNPFVDESALDWFEDGALAFVEGRIVGCGDYPEVRRGYPDAAVSDQRDAFLIPGFVDCHVHFPQLPIIGSMGLELLDWSRAGGIGAAALVHLLFAALGSALAVAFIEETFLRGAMYTAIERESGARAAVLLTSLLYAATHFFGKVRIAPADVTPWSGVALLEHSLRSFAHFVGIADAFLALMEVGVVLALVRQASGNIAACLGLHAGWVWVMLVAHELTAPRREAQLGFLLSRFDGFVGWLVLLGTVLLAVPLWRYFARRAAHEPQHSRAAGESRAFRRRQRS